MLTLVDAIEARDELCSSVNELAAKLDVKRPPSHTEPADTEVVEVAVATAGAIVMEHASVAQLAAMRTEAERLAELVEAAVVAMGGRGNLGGCSCVCCELVRYLATVVPGPG